MSSSFTQELIDQFVEDFYDLFMEGFIESTNKYTVIYEDEYNSSEARAVLDLGLANDWLWVVPIDGTPLVYIELVDLVVCEHLLQHYVSKLGYVGEEAVSIIASIKDNYLREVVRFLESLPKLSGTEKDLKSFGIVNMTDSQSLWLDDKQVPVFNLSIKEFLTLIESVQLRPYGFWTAQEHHQFKDPKGEFKQPLKGVRVDELISSIFIRGVYPKRKSVHN